MSVFPELQLNHDTSAVHYQHQSVCACVPAFSMHHNAAWHTGEDLSGVLAGGWTLLSQHAISELRHWGAMKSRQRASSPRQANKEGGSYVMKDIWQEKQKKWVSFGVELVSQF